MNRTRELQHLVDTLADKYIPALAGAKVICFGQTYEVWMPPSTKAPSFTAVAGGCGTILLWLGCVALTGKVHKYEYFSPYIVSMVIRSAEVAGVL